MKIKKKFQGALPSNKILNIKSNSQIDTYSCDYINKNKENYSTEEQVIGTWIDGKPLYRKVINISSTHGNGDYDLGLPDTIDYITGRLLDYKTNRNDTQTIVGGNEYWSGDSDRVCIALFRIPWIFNFRPYIYITSSYILFDIHFVVEYTKTTD